MAELTHKEKQQRIASYKKNELIKCIKDSIYFMTEYCYIQHPTKGRIKFNLYDFQKDTLVDIAKNAFTVILKARQLGISTLVAGYALWLAMFHKDKNILVVATKLVVAKNLVTKIKMMYDNLPEWIKSKYPTVEFNKTSIALETGSVIKAVAMTEDAGRSEALSLLIIDECVSEDTRIIVRNKKTKVVETIEIGEMFKSISN